MNNTYNDPDAWRDLVRHGYDRISHAYRADARDPVVTSDYAEWLAPLHARLEPDAHVLDLGCGCGEPVLRMLAEHHRVTGVDLSPVQVERARQLVPTANLHVADMLDIDFADATFDAIVSIYAIIHVPRRHHRTLFARIHRWLRPGGLALLVVGHTAWQGVEDFHGVEMGWSHASADQSAAWLDEAGFQLVERTFVPEGDSGHDFFLARRT